MVPVSVVIPCFRAAHTIGRALRSVGAQTVLPREIIVVDDASDDGTAERVRQIAAALDLPLPVRVQCQRENRGAGEARNAGWDTADGDYVAFLDADDAWHPQKIERQSGFMEAHRDIGISGHRHRVVLGDSPPAAASLEAGHRILGRRDFLLANRFVTPSVMLRTSLPLRFATGKRHMEDHHLWAQAACQGVGIARLDAELCDIFKPSFGHTGLSAQLWKMEMGELDSYRRLRSAGHVGAAVWAGLSAWSLAKFMRRLAIVTVRRVAR